MSETNRPPVDSERYRSEDLPSYLLFFVPKKAFGTACSSLWEQLWASSSVLSPSFPNPNQFTLQLIDPLSGQERTVSIQCASEGRLQPLFDTTANSDSLSDCIHPCNKKDPPCLGTPPPELEEDTPRPIIYAPPPQKSSPLKKLFVKIVAFFRSRKRLGVSHQPASQARPPAIESKKSGILAQVPLPASLQIPPNCHAYQVIIRCDYRRILTNGAFGDETLFSVCLSFDRCGLGITTLSFRCAWGDTHGLILNIT